VIENGVNVQKYAGRGSQHLSPVMIYFGRWSANKGLIETIALMRQLVARHPEWKLIIAGREYDHSVADLTALIEQNGLTAHVRLAPNPGDSELADLIGQASYYICLSRHEGFGIAPIEGMSAGLTPILSDIPPFRNLVEKSNIGLLLHEPDGDAVGQIAALHAQGQHAHDARRIATQVFVQQYDWRHIADRYVQIYRDLVQQRTAGNA
jgi:alpha-1,3-mannosyltransferase